MTEAPDPNLFCEFLLLGLTDLMAEMGVETDGSITTGTVLHRVRQRLTRPDLAAADAERLRTLEARLLALEAEVVQLAPPPL